MDRGAAPTAGSKRSLEQADGAAAEVPEAKRAAVTTAGGEDDVDAAFAQVEAAGPSSSAQPASKGQSGAVTPAVPAQQAALPPPHGPQLPPGWLETPPRAGSWQRLVPVKVPLGSKYHDVIPEHLRFTPQMLLAQLRAEGKEVGLILDLTKSWRYYDVEEFCEVPGYEGVLHHKVPMQGRGAVPEPEAINHIVWLVLNYTLRVPDRHIVVHCTHGFNRTGYVIASVMLRFTQNLSVAQAVTEFARQRPPGIYKEDYVQSLFDYYHERRPSAMGPPPKPPWKDEDEDPPKEEDEELKQVEADAGPPPMKHDDVIGEAIDADEELEVQRLVMGWIMPDSNSAPRFPGSQPVSLARSNLHLLSDRRDDYMVTWKADGTRYMLLLCKWGAYVIDRSYRIRRVQLRCIVKQPPGHRHHNTLLDGEMVVDTDAKTKTCRRRYLAYDLMVLNNTVVAHCPFKERIKLLKEHVLQPRDKERSLPGVRYLYEQEPFGMRFKEFWAVAKSGSILQKFVRQLTHECDGLIFQPGADPYVPGTCEELLKWKFAHMNSVDFLLRQSSTGGFQLCLMRGKRDGEAAMVPLPDAQVLFPEGHTPMEYLNRVIECCWDEEKKAWTYMRHRDDKLTPNAYHVYEKVLQSIRDNITEEELVAYVNPAAGGGAGGPLQQANGAAQQQQPPQQPPQPQQRQQHANGAA